MDQSVPVAPDITRPDAGVAIVREFVAGTAGRQRDLIDAAFGAVRVAAVPPALLSLTWLASTDGEKVLSYAQWTAEDEALLFSRVLGTSVQQAVAARAPGITASPAVSYRRYRSAARPDAPPPGCIVIGTVEFDGPDADRQRAWIDLVLDALESEPAPDAGGGSRHFHVSTDGTRVLSYAEWIDEASHLDAVAGDGTVGDGSGVPRARAFPGIVRAGVTRYRIERAIAGGGAL
jgi:hypothetical protein